MTWGNWKPTVHVVMRLLHAHQVTSRTRTRARRQQPHEAVSDLRG